MGANIFSLPTIRVAVPGSKAKSALATSRTCTRRQRQAAWGSGKAVARC